MMIGIFVGGPFAGQAREVDDSPPELYPFESQGQNRGEGTRHLYYGRSRTFEQDAGDPIVIYRMSEEVDGDPSPFEELLEESVGRFGNAVHVDASDLMAIRVWVGDADREGVVSSDVHAAARHLSAELGWPRPS